MADGEPRGCSKQPGMVKVLRRSCTRNYKRIRSNEYIVFLWYFACPADFYLIATDLSPEEKYVLVSKAETILKDTEIARTMEKVRDFSLDLVVAS